MLFTMQGIHKSFGANDVLNDVSFSLEQGEIRALLGENGAGKSTLMNILGGVLKPDRGEIIMNGRPVAFHTPSDSMNAGIAFIHQELNLVNDLSIYENLFISRELKKGGFLDHRSMIQRTREVLERMQVDVDPRALVRTLDASYKQIIEIARALLMNATTIIMDEPTTSLTDVEIERVFGIMRTLKSHGVGIVFISHKLREVLAVCDTYTVLRDGVVVRDGLVSETDELSLARYMVGHDVRTERLNAGAAVGDEVLRVERMSMPPAFRDISFSLRAGEILGVTGLLGDGRSELFRAVFGCKSGWTGDVYLYGKKTRLTSAAAAYKAGLGYVPRDRKENGIIKDMSILENGSIVTIGELCKPLIDHRRERRLMQEQIDGLSIKVADMDEGIGSLSGGNQQKVVLAKWLEAHPRILIFDNPTQGVDVGAKEDIYDIILRLASEGVAICVLSSEPREVIRLCHRVLVMYHGHIQGELSGDDMTEAGIMAYATGGLRRGAE
ncbi:MAG: sugar ABC transporter ATP-binding protein [Clostridia bacterium]|nr:sugar ABC transporter ATP-binding protein [Clostridia bacterium]